MCRWPATAGKQFKTYWRMVWNSKTSIRMWELSRISSEIRKEHQLAQNAAVCLFPKQVQDAGFLLQSLSLQWSQGAAEKSLSPHQEWWEPARRMSSHPQLWNAMLEGLVGEPESRQHLLFSRTEFKPLVSTPGIPQNGELRWQTNPDCWNTNTWNVFCSLFRLSQFL